MSRLADRCVVLCRRACGALLALLWLSAAATAFTQQVQDLKPGSAVWHVAGDGRGVPAADASSAYFLSRTHEVIAIDAEQGTVRWRGRTDEPGGLMLGSTILLTDSLVIAGDYDVVAFDRETGVEKWRFVPTDGYAPGVYLGSAADGLVFTGSPSGSLYALDAQTGRVSWSAAIAAASDVPKTTVYEPVVSRGRVFAGYRTSTAPSTGGMIAADVDTGRLLWRTAFPPAPSKWVSTAFAGGPVLADHLVVGTSSDGTIHAMEEATGVIRWTLPPASGLRNLSTDYRALARSGCYLIAGSTSSVVTCYDLDTLRVRWRAGKEADGSVAFWIGADADLAYIPFLGGRLVAFDIHSGKERWSVGDYRNVFMHAPFVVEHRVYAAASSGFFAFQR